jgi:ABC-type multidrug transport system ATPase subunit
LTNDFAARVRNVWDVFIDDTNKPIVAANNLSLGVRHGTLVGFLGTNGAGKRTLMKMTTSEISSSNGFLNVDENGAVCPPFNNHLTNEMALEKHFQFFFLIFGLHPIDAQRKQE